MRFVIYGAGAIGGVIGARLALSDFNVVLVDRNRDHVAAIRRNGLICKGIAGTHRITSAAAFEPGELEFTADDFLVFAVKSGHTNDILTQIRAKTSLNLPVFCAQNGVHNEELAARYFERVHGMMVLIGAKFVTPGEVVYTAAGPIGVGAHPTGIGAGATVFAAALSKAGFAAYTTDDIWAAKWNKLLWNLTSSIQALTGLSGPETRARQDVRTLMADVMEEGLRVVQAANIKLAEPPGAAPAKLEIERLRSVAPPPISKLEDEAVHYGSPWQDLFHRRGEVEAEYINGEIVRLGRRLGVPTPYNSTLLDLINRMAAAGERPGKYSVVDLRRHAEQLRP